MKSNFITQDGGAQNMDGRLLTRREVAAYLQTCEHTVARYTKRGLLPCVRINQRTIRYHWDDLQALLK